MVTDSMAHDLRSPVARMKSTLEQAITQTTDKVAVHALADSIEEADSLHRLLNTALEISRAEAGIGRNQFTAFSLFELMQDIAEVYGPLAEEEGYEIGVNVTGPLRVFAHRELLTRALSNLVDNALKYADGGSMILLRAQALGSSMVRLEVADDGPGIPDARKADALRRFGRLDPARTQSGAGLGLSLVETIAHLHGGMLMLEENDPHGLCVTLQLPVGIAV
jgi:signal transduction histidine kinase